MGSQRKQAQAMFVDKFLEAQRKSQGVFQYKCKCNRKVWWGGAKNNTCRKCSAVVEKLPLEKMVGVGWFECALCNRRFAGFAQGNVASPCHLCHAKLFPSFIVPGDNVQGEKKKHDHCCAACGGSQHCPIVEKAMSMGGRRK